MASIGPRCTLSNTRHPVCRLSLLTWSITGGFAWASGSDSDSYSPFPPGRFNRHVGEGLMVIIYYHIPYHMEKGSSSSSSSSFVCWSHASRILSGVARCLIKSILLLSPSTADLNCASISHNFFFFFLQVGGDVLLADQMWCYVFFFWLQKVSGWKHDDAVPPTGRSTYASSIGILRFYGCIWSCCS